MTYFLQITWFYILWSYFTHGGWANLLVALAFFIFLKKNLTQTVILLFLVAVSSNKLNEGLKK